MPSLDWNKSTWGGKYDWPDDGHQWSERFGGAEAQWNNVIHSRIHRLLPSRSILEIAPGRGRWTPFLLGNAETYNGIDIVPELVEHCRRAYGTLKARPKFHLGDGFRLTPIRDASVTLVFSFDSLVHCEMDTIASYAGEIFRVLEPGGHAFIHHSNLGQYVEGGRLTVRGPNGGRGATVSAVGASRAFAAAGLAPLVHETVQWRFAHYTDCFSLVRKPLPEDNGAPPKLFANDVFPAEIKLSKLLGESWGAALAG